MPLYEYAAAYCLESLFCPKRFCYRQEVGDAPRAACERCGVPLERVLSSFSAGSIWWRNGRPGRRSMPDRTRRWRPSRMSSAEASAISGAAIIIPTAHQIREAAAAAAERRGRGLEQAQ